MKTNRILQGCLIASFCLPYGSAWAQVVTEFSAGITTNAQPVGIAKGPDGNLWFTEQISNRIGQLALSAPVLVGAASRKMHGAAGTFDLPLAMNAINPVREPRQSSTATIVMPLMRRSSAPA